LVGKYIRAIRTSEKILIQLKQHFIGLNTQFEGGEPLMKLIHRLTSKDYHNVSISFQYWRLIKITHQIMLV